MKHHITSLYPRDEKTLKMLACVGYADHEQLHEFLRDKRINGYLKDRLIEKERLSVPGHPERDRICYKLTDHGRAFCRRELGLEHVYHAQSPRHDLPLADRYLSLTPEERATWRTEGDLRATLDERIQDMDPEKSRQLRGELEDGRISMPDAAYTASDGEEVSFEVVTDSYGRAEIEAKQNAAVALGTVYQEVRVS